MIHLILGGARSGKSAFAQKSVTQLQQKTEVAVTYVATATAIDDEMRNRIKRHQKDRPDNWNLAEVPVELSEFLRQTESQQQPSSILLIDCLTLWLNNQLYHFPEQDFALLFEDLSDALEKCCCDVFLVANEVGLGVIPMGEVSRQFVDQAGWLNQKMATIADKVTFVCAGLPLPLKQ